jgi:hypothetical protein
MPDSGVVLRTVETTATEAATAATLVVAWHSLRTPTQKATSPTNQIYLAPSGAESNAL